MAPACCPDDLNSISKEQVEPWVLWFTYVPTVVGSCILAFADLPGRQASGKFLIAILGIAHIAYGFFAPTFLAQDEFSMGFWVCTLARGILGVMSFFVCVMAFSNRGIELGMASLLGAFLAVAEIALCWVYYHAITADKLLPERGMADPQAWPPVQTVQMQQAPVQAVQMVPVQLQQMPQVQHMPLAMQAQPQVGVGQMGQMGVGQMVLVEQQPVVSSQPVVSQHPMMQQQQQSAPAGPTTYF